MIQNFIVTAIVIGGAFGIMLVLEMLYPLRRPVEPKLLRTTRNLTLAGITAAVVMLLQTPLLIPITTWAREHNAGLLNLVNWPRGVETAIAVVLLDYTLWFWHWANHRVPVLWRFHLVHHVDLDLDSSTAFRFHFGEMALSLVYRGAQIAVIGADAASLWIWQLILFVSILFHHSNLRLPAPLEQWLVRLIVTPRMHGIHHSDLENETNSNWSSMLSCWDYLHGTILLNVPQRKVRIGVPAYEDPRQVTIGKVLALPFLRHRPYWLRPDGTLATRDHDTATRRNLSE